jgi:putative DNA primase/helicase
MTRPIQPIQQILERLKGKLITQESSARLEITDKNQNNQYSQYQNSQYKQNSQLLNIIEIQDFLNLTLPQREYIVEPWLPRQGLTMVYAPRGIGKTLIALGLAYAVSQGLPFLHWKIPKPKGVLYLDGEMPATVMQERLKAIAQSTNNQQNSPNNQATQDQITQTQKQSTEPPTPAPFRLLTPDLQKNGIPDLSTKRGQALIEPYLKNIDLIIVDNISTLCRSGKENEAEGWLPIQDWALNMRSAGRSVLFIHHAGKAGNQRGTSKREDVLDTVISLTRPENYKPSEGAVFQVHFQKARGFYGEAAKSFEVQLSTEQNNQLKWITRSLEESTHDKVVNLKNQGYKQQEIAGILDINKSNVSRHIKHATNMGLIDKEKTYHANILY